MRCEVIYAEQIPFSKTSLTGVTSGLYIQAVQFVKPTVESDVDVENSDADCIDIDVSSMNNRMVSTINKILFFDTPESEDKMLKLFGKLFEIDTNDTNLLGKKKTNKPVLLNIERVVVKMPCEFYQRYNSTTDTHNAGDFVCDVDGKPRQFENITINVLCDAQDKPKEDANFLAKRNWDTNLATEDEYDKIYVPVELYNKMEKKETPKQSTIRGSRH